MLTGSAVKLRISFVIVYGIIAAAGLMAVTVVVPSPYIHRTGISDLDHSLTMLRRQEYPYFARLAAAPQRVALKSILPKYVDLVTDALQTRYDGPLRHQPEEGVFLAHVRFSGPTGLLAYYPLLPHTVPWEALPDGQMAYLDLEDEGHLQTLRVNGVPYRLLYDGLPIPRILRTHRYVAGFFVFKPILPSVLVFGAVKILLALGTIVAFLTVSGCTWRVVSNYEYLKLASDKLAGCDAIISDIERFMVVALVPANDPIGIRYNAALEQRARASSLLDRAVVWRRPKELVPLLDGTIDGLRSVQSGQS